MRRLPLRSRGYGCFLTLTLCMVLAAAPVHAQHAAPGHHAKALAQTAKKTEAKPAAPAQEQFADGIAAVVGKDVITMSDLNKAMQQATDSLKMQRIQIPPLQVLQHQVLNRLIMNRVMDQEAKRQGISVTSGQVDQAIALVASRNHLTVPQMKAEIVKSGTNWDDYRKTIHDEMLSERLRQRVVEAKIFISDSEVDAFLKEYAHNKAVVPAPAVPEAAPAPAQPQVKIVANGPIALSDILIHVPDGASPETVASLRQKAEGLLARLRKGADFAGLAAANSDGPNALQGGQLGVRPLEGWPDLFVSAVRNLMPGQVTGVLRAANGFHIIKVTARAMERVAAPVRQQQQVPPGIQQLDSIPSAAPGTIEITQTHARHILIKTSAVMTDAEARQKLEEIRQRIVSGQATFGEMARQYSQDSSASEGGDLGWLSPGQTVPAFEQAMDKLKPGQISEPIASPFGWHLIQVIARRQHDATQEVRRNRARQILMERQAGPAFEDYMDQVQAQTYIDNRLERAQELKQRYQQ
ncbi:peptidylprolyl isomerase [Bordetella sp. FB-8]|uniref:peptidylprolyl isomerase n=1 Tax=Bordetella sp. FB-8 TaxID=1159870 RepID=UPI00037C1237|nr:peptidylprolyl isomerase [Bordetella sp. FB-8]